MEPNDGLASTFYPHQLFLDSVYTSFNLKTLERIAPGNKWTFKASIRASMQTSLGDYEIFIYPSKLCATCETDRVRTNQMQTRNTLT